MMPRSVNAACLKACDFADSARVAVVVGGVPQYVVEQAESRHGDVDWRLLAGALDGLFMSGGGSLQVRRFLCTPDERFSGRTPVEELVLFQEGASRVAEVAVDLAERTHLAKVS